MDFFYRGGSLMKNIFATLISGLILIFISGTIPAAACVATSMDDYGDAPDTYSTLLASGGAFHGIGIPDLYLGSGVSYESDGKPSPLFDDFDDGVALPGKLVQGSNVWLGVTSSLDGILNAWMDFNGDGDWDDPDEQIFNDESLVAGSNTLDVYIPDDAFLGFTYARFRLNLTGGLNYNGEAFNGEVEDYRVEITSPVPAPAAIVLFGIGLLGLAGAGRRKLTQLE
jgi:hypothetical protein